MNSKHTAYPKTIDGASRTKSPSNGEGIEEATRADGNGRTSWEPAEVRFGQYQAESASTTASKSLQDRSQAVEF
jgi:hypothetical protein